MNIMNKKNRIIFAIILLLQLSFLPNVNAEDTQEIDDEELPAIDPFGTGATLQDASGDTTTGFGVSSSVIDNMKLMELFLEHMKNLLFYLCLMDAH